MKDFAEALIWYPGLDWVEPDRVTTMPQQNHSTPSYKKEVVNRKIYPTRKHAIKDVTAWIE